MNDVYMNNPLKKRTASLLVCVSLIGALSLQAQVVPPLSAEGDGPDRLINLNFRDSPLDQVLTFYSELTGRTMIKSPGINATISLRGQTRMTETEALQAIESALAMHNVTLIPMGDRFLRVVQPTAARQEGLAIIKEQPEEALPETDQLMTMIINLQHTEISEVQPIFQQLIHGYGKIQALERTNSMMITDTSSNLNRIMEILEFIDRPAEIREDIFVRQIRHAQAGEIASRLNEFIQDREEAEERPRIAPPTEERRGPPGVIRAQRAEQQQTAATAIDSAAALAERGVIQGRVKIVADDRVNMLFIISRPANFAFFDRIIDVLDQPVDPEIIVRVINLEYALAEDVAAILNEFVGAASSEENAAGGALRAGETGEETGGSRAEALRDFAAGLVRERQAQTSVTDESTQIGRLSPDTRILSDPRSNALLLMGRQSDVSALLDVVDELDIMLGQVLIEAVIVEISLGNTVESGIDWLQRTLSVFNEQQAGPGGGVTVRDPVGAFGGSFGDGARDIRDALLDGVAPAGGAGLSYYLSFFDLNLDVVIRLAATSRDARILSTPVILTTDNTEANIIVGESRPVVTSTSSSSIGDRQVSQFQFRDIGINLTVTPRINPQRFVVMDILQTADNVGGFETIDDNRVPVITRREMSAQIAVRNRATIVLGGLVSTDRITDTSKIPLLGDIPLLGRLFRTDNVEDSRTELLVLITPYVMMTPEEARMESARLHYSSHSSNTEWHQGWSDSEFASPKTESQPRDKQEEDRVEAPFAVPPAEADPLSPGRYDRNEVRGVLKSLNPGHEYVHEEPAGFIQWEERGDDVDQTPARPEESGMRPTQPESAQPAESAAPDASSQTSPVPEPIPEPIEEPVPEPVEESAPMPASEDEPDDESEREPVPARPVLDIHAPVPMR